MLIININLHHFFKNTKQFRIEELMGFVYIWSIHIVFVKMLKSFLCKFRVYKYIMKFISNNIADTKRTFSIFIKNVCRPNSLPFFNCWWWSKRFLITTSFKNFTRLNDWWRQTMCVCVCVCVCVCWVPFLTGAS